MAHRAGLADSGEARARVLGDDRVLPLLLPHPLKSGVLPPVLVGLERGEVVHQLVELDPDVVVALCGTRFLTWSMVGSACAGDGGSEPIATARTTAVMVALTRFRPFSASGQSPLWCRKPTG